jgi:alcohol dehydrogenase class IV
MIVAHGAFSQRGGRIGIVEFAFFTAARIVFGAGRLPEAATVAKDLGDRALVFTGSNEQRAQPLLTALTAAGLYWTTHPVSGEPEVHALRTAVRVARDNRADVVIGIGGGSVLDTAKAAAILAGNGGDILDYLEIIGGGRALEHPGLPFLAIPTTSGSGAEVTWNSVIASRDQRVKVSLRSPLMAARLALVDPELTYDMPPALTASTGMDALCQLLEAYVTVKANPLTDGLCLQGMSRAARSLRRAATEGRDPAAREDMSVASLFGGMALAGAGLGAAHGIAGPLGGMIDAHHGALCAALLPRVTGTNIRLLRERLPGGEALHRYRTVAALLTGRDDVDPEDCAVWLRDLVRDLGIPGLSHHGLQSQDIPELVEKAARASSMKGNPVLLSEAELAGIITGSL